MPTRYLLSSIAVKTWRAILHLYSGIFGWLVWVAGLGVKSSTEMFLRLTHECRFRR